MASFVRPYIPHVGCVTDSVVEMGTEPKLNRNRTEPESMFWKEPNHVCVSAVYLDSCPFDILKFSKLVNAVKTQESKVLFT